MAATTNLRRLATTILRQPEWILALAVTTVIIWLHFFFLLHVGGFWRDEVNLINLSGRHSLAEMSKDSFPVLMPLLVSGWTATGLGQNDLTLRLLGTLIGLVLPAALWLAVWKIHRRPPLLSLVLLTLNCTVIMFGDSLRAFGLGSLTILLTTASAGWFLQKPTWRRAGILAVLAILSVQSLFQNAVFIAAICFGGWAVCLRQKNFRTAMKILSVALVSAASLLPYWSRLASLPASAAALRVGFRPRYVFTNFDIAAGFPMEQYVWVWGFFTLTVVVCGLVLLFAQKQTTDESISANPSPGVPLLGYTTLVVALATVAGFFWFAAAPATHWCFFPLLALAIVWCDGRFTNGPFKDDSRANRKTQIAKDLPLFAGVTLLAAFAGFAGFLWYAALISEPWYFLPLLAVAATAFELGLPAGRHFHAAIFGLAAMTLVLAIPAARDGLNWRFTNVDLLARNLTAEAKPGDFIVVSPWYCGITFDRYYHGPASWNTLPPLKDHSIHRYDLIREAMGRRDAIQPVFGQITAALQSGHRVWMVGTVNLPRSGAPMPADLPPAPTNYAGTELRYTQNWTVQVAQFLSDHGRQFTEVDFKTGQNVAPENLKLFLAEGWQSPTNGAP